MKKSDDFYFYIEYTNRLIESRKIKKSFLKKIYRYSYMYATIICFMGAGILIPFNSLPKTLPTIFAGAICMFIGLVLMGRLSIEAEFYKDFQEYLITKLHK